jgi:hypothetical protein
MKLLIWIFILFIFFSCDNSSVNYKTNYYINTQLSHNNDSITIETKIINHNTNTIEYDGHITTSLNNDTMNNLILQERIKAEKFLSILKNIPSTTHKP